MTKEEICSLYASVMARLHSESPDRSDDWYSAQAEAGTRAEMKASYQSASAPPARGEMSAKTYDAVLNVHHQELWSQVDRDFAAAEVSQ